MAKEIIFLVEESVEGGQNSGRIRRIRRTPYLIVGVRTDLRSQVQESN